MANNSQASELSLVAGDLSGIQKFIYTISSDGALKSLRARSFYLELVTEEVVQQLLAALDLPSTNIIYTGGGNLYLLAPGTEDSKNIIQQVRQQFNQWLLEEFQGKVFLALDCLPFPLTDVTTAEFAKHWSKVTHKLAEHKAHKFAEQITNFITQRDSYEPCRVCHRDDVAKLKRLNSKAPDAVLACETCCSMFELGGQLLRVKAIARSQLENISGALHTLSFKLPATSQRDATNVYYHLFRTWKPIVPESDTVLLVNDWTVEHYRFRHFRKSVPLLLGNYGILNSLAANRWHNLPKQQAEIKTLTQDARLNLLFIYAGGDDLFVSGAWNEVVEFAFDVYQCFRAYTGNNSDVTLSGGISIADAKFPLYQAAQESGSNEDAAKGNGRDSLSLFGQVFKWDEWLVTAKYTIFDEENKKYSQQE